MKNQINLLNQLQELVFTRDELHQTGDWSHTDALDRAIDDLTAKLEPQPRALYQRLYKKSHIVMAPMSEGCCAVCGMRLPISQVQQVRMAKTLQTCSSCGRMLYNEEEDAPRYIGEKPTRGEPRKTGISRFSAEELMVCDLKGDTTEAVIGELAEAMSSNRFVSNPSALVEAAMERESVLSTAGDHGLAFPHVRGVEGGGLTLALGVSKKGFKYDAAGTIVHLVFFSVIPVAVSPFYMRLMAVLAEAFSKESNRAALLSAAKSPAELWKAFMKTTRHAVH